MTKMEPSILRMPVTMTVIRIASKSVDIFYSEVCVCASFL